MPGRCAVLPLSPGAAAASAEPLTLPFPTQGKKQQELQETMQELSQKVSVPSSALAPAAAPVAVPGAECLCPAPLPEPCCGAVFREQLPGAAAAGGAGGPDEGQLTESQAG